MKYQEFITNVKEYMSNQVPASHKVMVQPVLKNNGTVFDGLIVIDPILNISPTIYLNPFYHRYLNGISLGDILEDIWEIYKNNIPDEDFDISLFEDFEKAKNTIIIKLVNAEKNRELLKDVPHVLYHDLAMIFVCAVCDFMEEYATILIHNQHMNMWGTNVEELLELGLTNTPRLLPSRFDHMEKILAHLSDSLPFHTDINMYLLTNQTKIHGATCLVYPGLLKSIAEDFQDNLIIIPSSIHELLIIPEQALNSEYSSIHDFDELIIEVNETQLTDDEVLSNHAYLYDREKEELIF